MNVLRVIAGIVLLVATVVVSGCEQAGSSASHVPREAALSQPAASEQAGGVTAATNGAPKAEPTPATRHIGRAQTTTGGDGRTRNITFDKLKFPMADPKSREFKLEYLTPEIKKLDGTRIRIRGFMLPTATEEVSGFIFVRDNQECCFGPGATLYDAIVVAMSPGTTMHYVTRPVTVEGDFEIKELVGPDEKHLSIYRMTATSVE